jgi:hypothetical protein
MKKRTIKCLPLFLMSILFIFNSAALAEEEERKDGSTCPPAAVEPAIKATAGDVLQIIDQQNPEWDLEGTIEHQQSRFQMKINGTGEKQKKSLRGLNLYFKKINALKALQISSKKQHSTLTQSFLGPELTRKTYLIKPGEMLPGGQVSFKSAHSAGLPYEFLTDKNSSLRLDKGVWHYNSFSLKGDLSPSPALFNIRFDLIGEQKIAVVNTQLYYKDQTELLLAAPCHEWPELQAKMSVNLKHSTSDLQSACINFNESDQFI